MISERFVFREDNGLLGKQIYSHILACSRTVLISSVLIIFASTAAHTLLGTPYFRGLQYRTAWPPPVSFFETFHTFRHSGNGCSVLRCFFAEPKHHIHLVVVIHARKAAPATG